MGKFHSKIYGKTNEILLINFDMCNNFVEKRVDLCYNIFKSAEYRLR